jgi:hypothetical protein
MGPVMLTVNFTLGPAIRALPGTLNFHSGWEVTLRKILALLGHPAVATVVEALFVVAEIIGFIVAADDDDEDYDD